ncbi:MAG: serine hydrolase [Clostridium sp.]|nr:serine hydrolase [Clostridium sp.]
MKDLPKLIAAVFVLSAAIFIIGTVKNNIDDTYTTPQEMIIYTNEELLASSRFIGGAMTDTVVSPDYELNAAGFDNLYYALVIDETSHEVVAAKNPHKRMYPASMTKLMTAIVVCDQLEAGIISKDDVVTLDKNYYISVPGVGTSELTYGCSITVDNLMHGLLIESNNYYALILADYIAGDVESFCNMMNDKAKSLGATNTHYMNPHGLDDPNHYSTAYDIYLIIKEAKSHSYITEIAPLSEYSYIYHDSYGEVVEKEINATNMFVGGRATLPSGYHITAWKTGTTTGAGNCLALYLANGNQEYVVVASSKEDRKDLYNSIVELICLIGQ